MVAGGLVLNLIVWMINAIFNLIFKQCHSIKGITMKICTRLSTAFTVWYLMFGNSYTILSKNRSIILVILFVLDAIILRYLLNDRMKENKSKEVFLQTDIFVLISLIVLIPLHLDIVHPIIAAVLSGSVIIYQAIAITHNIKERRNKRNQAQSLASNKKIIYYYM